MTSLTPQSATIKFFGVGEAGLSVLGLLPPGSGAAIGVSASPDLLERLPELRHIQLNGPLPRRLPRGDLDAARSAAEAGAHEFRSAAETADVVFVIASLGGATGAATAPIIAREAREAGAQILAFATLPFPWEGERRAQLARWSLAELRQNADAVLCLPHAAGEAPGGPARTLTEVCANLNRLVADAVLAVAQIIERPGRIHVDFADLCDLLARANPHTLLISASAAGPGRVEAVARALVEHSCWAGPPGAASALSLLATVSSGDDITVDEIQHLTAALNPKCNGGELVLTMVEGEPGGSQLSVRLLVACGASASTPRDQHPGFENVAGAPQPAGSAGEEGSPRPKSKFVPPPPALTHKQAQELYARQNGNGRTRKLAARWCQTQLPLEIVSKGRFEKSEPTIHHGEDLDVPTYIRRGVALN